MYTCTRCCRHKGDMSCTALRHFEHNAKTYRTNSYDNPSPKATILHTRRLELDIRKKHEEGSGITCRGKNRREKCKNEHKIYINTLRKKVLNGLNFRMWHYVQNSTRFVFINPLYRTNRLSPSSIDLRCFGMPLGGWGLNSLRDQGEVDLNLYSE